MDRSEREQWLEDSEAFFENVHRYNATIMTVGYGTFFGLLIFLQAQKPGPLVFLAGLLIALSALVFVAWELATQVKLALETRKAGQEGKRWFRFWACFFIPSLALGLAGAGILVWLFLDHLLPG